jgi:histidinol-phosphate aminotransferase
MGSARRAVDDAVGALPAAVNPIALSLNENPYPPLPSVRGALIASLDAANRYPEFLPERLRRLIAGHVGVAAEQVVIGAGATGVILQVLHAVTSPGDRMVLASPTFDGYPIFAQMARLISVTVALDAHGHHDLDAMADAAERARVVVVCRPHNPTGTVETAADIERFLRRVPSDTVVVLDEAYVEFLSPEHRIDAVELVRRYPNVVVLRTFSKAYGLAGLRIGYGFCAPDLARALWAMQLPFGVGTTGLVAVAASYDAENELRQRIRMIAAERRYLAMRLRAMGIYCTDGQANFVYLPPQGRAWPAVFEDAGLHVRGYADGGVRITVGNRQSTRAVLTAVAEAGLRGRWYEKVWPPDPTRVTPSHWPARTGRRRAGVMSPTAWWRSRRSCGPTRSCWRGSRPRCDPTT